VIEPSFKSLSLSDSLLGNLDSLGYVEMTQVQSQTLPLILSGQDVIGQSETGSGKTVAFALGILNQLQPHNLSIQALVLCPTRELATQVAEETRRLARTIDNVKVSVLCGGIPIKRQIESMKHGTHIIIGTPGRIADHLRRESIDLQNLRTCVFDEADRMLDMGFQEEIDYIASQLPAARQTLLFSATFPGEIKQIALRVLREPTHVKADPVQAAPSVKQSFYLTNDESRLDALMTLIASEQAASCLVFCQTRQQSKDVYLALQAKGYSALALHGEMDQRDRDEALVRFANGSVTILVATDVAARGLDIDKLALVINYQLSSDPNSHIHRIGRTGRAGNSGRALTLVTERDRSKVEYLAEAMNQPTTLDTLPNADIAASRANPAPMVTLLIQGGKKQKLRAGDILGALTGADGIDGKHVGKINISTNHTYVAVDRTSAGRAIQKLKSDKIKGKSFRVRAIR